MFSGIVQEIGKVVRATQLGGGVKLVIEALSAAKELRVGDSVCVSGVCQTVVERNGDSFAVEAVEETVRKTTLGELRASSPVNIELPVRLNDRIGGHLVQGHVDGVGTVRSVQRLETSWLVTIGMPGEFMRYVIPVGSIAVDGVSLTVASVADAAIVVSIIPHTWRNTTFQNLHTGSKVNIELDIVGKYVERLLGGGRGRIPEGGISLEKLRAWGYDTS